MTVYTKDNKIFGLIRDGIFIKRVNRTRHLMRCMQAYGIDKNILLDLKEQGINIIKIIETDTKRTLETTVSCYLEKGLTENFGYGEQVFLPLSNFKVIK